MPSGSKVRSSKRTPGGTPCSSTGTTVVFISICALGVWMLSSNDLIPTQNTTTTPTTTRTEDEETKKTTFYEDNPGRLPEDAIKTGEVANQLPDIGLDNNNNNIVDKSIEDQKNALADNLKSSSSMESMLGNVKEVEGDENGETEKPIQEEEADVGRAVQDEIMVKSNTKSAKAKQKERKQKQQEQVIEKEETFLIDNQENGKHRSNKRK